MKPLIEVSDVAFRYDKRTNHFALNNISFHVNKGEWLAIVGNNGSGKSTLSNVLVGLLKPEKGTVKIGGMELNETTKWEIRRRIGIVFQNPDNQFIGATVQDDVAFSLENQNLPYKEMKNRVRAALDAVDMYEHRNDDPSRLSGGQKQRVAIASALALQPEALILDEALVMLDPKSRKNLLDSLMKLKEKSNLTVISITHDMNEAAMASRMIVLKNGTIAAIGRLADIFHKDLSLSPPFAERLKRTLQKLGRPVPDHYMNEEELLTFLKRCADNQMLN